jgi:predicted TIM-barrel fold metal-dependent hydrolase
MTNAPNAPLHKVLEYYKNKGCKGIGEVMPNMELMDPKVQNLFRAAEEVELPIVFDGSDVKDGDFGLYDDPGLPQLEHTLQRFPKLKIFGHGPVFWAELFRLQTPAERGYVFTFDGKDQVGKRGSESVEEGVLPVLLRRYENLYCDLSAGSGKNAIMRDEEYGLRFLEEFSDKVLYGCDICLASQTFAHDFDVALDRFVAEGSMSKENYYKFVRGNAIKVLKLDADE